MKKSKTGRPFVTVFLRSPEEGYVMSDKILDGYLKDCSQDENGNYNMQKELDTRKFAKYRTPTYHLTPTDNGVYFFSAVNAPAELTAPISYVWEYYDKTKNFMGLVKRIIREEEYA